MYPILFSIGRVHIYSHGLLMVIGALVGGILIFYLARQENLRRDFLFDLLVYGLLAGLLGARIAYVIVYFHQFTSFQDMFFIWDGGLISYGGMLGGLLLAYWFLKTKKENIWRWFDLGVIGLLAGWAFGRIGCLLNGDSYGIISSSHLAIWGRIPTQLFESIYCIILAATLYLIYRKKDELNLPDGFIFLKGIGAYALGRFIIDFWRDEEIFAFHLKAGQLSSLVIFILVMIIVYRLMGDRINFKRLRFR